MPNVLERQQDILSIISEYRGHFKCLCGSQKHLRDCHGKYVIAYYNNFDAYEFLKQDLSLIEYTLYKVRKGKE